MGSLAGSNGGAQTKPPKSQGQHGQLRRSQAGIRQGRGLQLQEAGQALGNCRIVVPRIRLGLVKGEDPEEVVGPWRSAEQEQEPHCLQAGQLRDAAEESVMLCTFEA